MKIQNILIALILALTFNLQFSTACAQGTLFTYQGRLMDGGQPANGSNYGMVFYLYDAATNGNVLGNEGIVSVTVINGLFTVPLDFGNVFDGSGRWLEIAVQKNGGGFTTLAPRQPLTPTPYAIFANTASNVVGTISSSQLPANVITNGASGVMLSGILARGGSPGPGGVNNNGYAFSGNGGDNDSGMFSSADGQIEFYNNANEVMRINLGQVGIGTTSPSGVLDVEGAGGSSAPIILSAGSGVSLPTAPFGFGAGGPGANIIITGGAGGNGGAFSPSGSGGNLILLPGASGTPGFNGSFGNPGYVGIGASSPVSQLNVVGSGGAGQGLQFDNREIKFRGDGDAHWSIFANRIPGTLTIEDTSAYATNGVAGIVAIAVEKTTGRVGIGTTSPGALLQVGSATCNGSTWQNASDRTLKNHFSTVIPQMMLDKVVALPITEWDYKQEAGTKHIGPMAQDFHAAFGLNGTDDKHIATVDEEGVALAAIQGLNQKLEETRAESKAKDEEIQALERKLDELEAAVKQLVAQKRQAGVDR